MRLPLPVRTSVLLTSLKLVHQQTDFRLFQDSDTLRIHNHLRIDWYQSYCETITYPPCQYFSSFNHPTRLRHESELGTVRSLLSLTYDIAAQSIFARARSKWPLSSRTQACRILFNEGHSPRHAVITRTCALHAHAAMNMQKLTSLSSALCQADPTRPHPSSFLRCALPATIKLLDSHVQTMSLT